jgi:serpin B
MRSRFVPLALLGSLTILAGCPGKGPTGDEDTGGESETGDEPTWPMAESELSRDEDPQPSADEQQALAADNHALSLDLYHILREGDAANEGFSVSAYSMQSAFGMLYGGTVEPAATEMATTLHFSLPGERQHVALNWIDQQLRSRNLEAIAEPQPQDPVIFETANRVWVQDDIVDEILPDYLDLLAVHYGTGIALADFEHATERERLDINAWVSNRTHELIPEFFKPGVLMETTTMVLVNAIYLKAPWAEPFDEDATSKADFTRLDGSVVQVDMMSKWDLYGGYGEGADYQALAIPMRGGQFELIAIVPSDFAAFEVALDVAKLDEVLASLEYGLVTTEFPRFEIELDVSLFDELQTLGMTLPFVDPSSFDGIAPGGPGIITDVIHHTVIEVDEKGTEAAAATGIVIGESGGGPEPEHSITVDRPFVLLLRDAPTDTLLFFGRVLDPTA